MTRRRAATTAIVAAVIAAAILAAMLSAQEAPDAPGFTDVAYTVVASGTGDATVVAAPATGRLRLVGVFAIEDAGSAAAAEIRLCDGACSASTEIVAISLTANESAREWWGPWGVPLTAGNGLVLDRVTGTTRFTVVTRVYR